MPLLLPAQKTVVLLKCQTLWLFCLKPSKESHSEQKPSCGLKDPADGPHTLYPASSPATARLGYTSLLRVCIPPIKCKLQEYRHLICWFYHCCISSVWIVLWMSEWLSHRRHLGSFYSIKFISWGRKAGSVSSAYFAHVQYCGILNGEETNITACTSTC